MALTQRGDIQLMTYGQSLSVGTNGGPAATTEQPFDSLRHSGLVPLVERNVETPVSAMTNHLRAFDDGSRRYINNATGSSGADWSQLKKGGPVRWDSMINNIASVEKRRPGTTVAAMAFVHGESDAQDACNGEGCEGRYRGYLQELRTDFDADAKRITGQVRDTSVFLCQLSSWSRSAEGVGPEVALEQLIAAQTIPGLFLVTPKYHLGLLPESIYSRDGVHLGNDRQNGARGYTLLGEYYGRALSETFDPDKNRPWRPLWPISAVANGSVIEVSYEVPCIRTRSCGVNPLTFDTSAVALTDSSGALSYGFRIRDPNPQPRFIRSVDLCGNVVRIVANDTISAGTSIEYGLRSYPGAHGGNGHHSSSYGGARGNLRDTDQTPAFQLPQERLVNWAVHSRTSVNGGAPAPASRATVLEDNTFSWAYIAEEGFLGAGCPQGADWSASIGGSTAGFLAGTYACAQSTLGASAQALGSTRVGRALRLSGKRGGWRAPPHPDFDAEVRDDLWIRFVGQTQRPSSDQYVLWYGDQGSGERYFIQFKSNGNVVVLYTSSDADLTTAIRGALPTESRYGIVDVLIDKRGGSGGLTITIAVNGAFASGRKSSPGGSNQGLPMSLLSGPKGDRPFLQAVTMIAGAYGEAAGQWSRAKHSADVERLTR